MAKAEEIPGLDCEASAATGIRLVLQARLKEMCALRPSALDWDHAAGVHDMHIASRRLRSALTDFKSCLRIKSLGRGRLKEIASILGATRDQDVAIDALESLKVRATEAVAAGFEPITDERRRRRKHARALLEKTLSEASLAKLEEKFNGQVEGAIRRPRRKKKGRKAEDWSAISFRDFGREVINARLKELFDGGESLYQPLRVKPLHRLRIKAKRLRYALELFACCSGNRLDGVAEEVAGLQTSLGELHDCDVWIEDLGNRLIKRGGRAAVTGMPKGVTGSVERNTTVWLLQHFTEERTKHFREALTRWHEWETSGFCGRLSDALKQLCIKI